MLINWWSNAGVGRRSFRFASTYTSNGSQQSVNPTAVHRRAYQQSSSLMVLSLMTSAMLESRCGKVRDLAKIGMSSHLSHTEMTCAIRRFVQVDDGEVVGVVVDA